MGRGIELDNALRILIETNVIEGNVNGVLLFNSETDLQSNTFEDNFNFDVFLNEGSRINACGMNQATNPQVSEGVPDQCFEARQEAPLSPTGRAPSVLKVPDEFATLALALGQAQATLRGNTIQGTKLTQDGFFGDGVFLGGAVRITVESNTIRGNKGFAIVLGESVRATVRNNTIESNGGGISIGFNDVNDETAEINLSENTIRNNLGCGLFVDPDEPGVRVTGVDNLISGNEFDVCDDGGKLPEGFLR